MKFKPGFFLALAIVLFGVVILGMRYNNIAVNDMKMELLRQDRAGEDVREEVETELKDFAFSRMNADVQIVLEGAHSRAVSEAELARDATVDGSVYEEAEEACDIEGQTAQENAECFQQFVASQLDDGAETDAHIPQLSEFSYIYYSPIWTFDVPGIALAGAILSTLMAFALYTRDGIRSLRRKHRE